MHPLYAQADALTREVIGAAIEVHRVLGPGLLESVYEKCMQHELDLRGLAWERQQFVTIRYKKLVHEEALKFDLLVKQSLLVEVKAVEAIAPIHQATALSYMKLLDVPVGLIINFHEVKLTDGVRRLYLPGANK